MTYGRQRSWDNIEKSNHFYSDWRRGISGPSGGNFGQCMDADFIEFEALGGRAKIFGQFEFVNVSYDNWSSNAPKDYPIPFYKRNLFEEYERRGIPYYVVWRRDDLGGFFVERVGNGLVRNPVKEYNFLQYQEWLKNLRKEVK